MLRKKEGFVGGMYLCTGVVVLCGAVENGKRGGEKFESKRAPW